MRQVLAHDYRNPDNSDNAVSRDVGVKSRNVHCGFKDALYERQQEDILRWTVAPTGRRSVIDPACSRWAVTAGSTGQQLTDNCG